MKHLATLCLTMLLIAITGCTATPRTPISIDQNFWSPEGKRIGVIMTAPPKEDVFLPGAGCLLCIAAAETANSSLSKHVDTLSHEELNSLKEEAARTLKERGFNVEIIEKPLNLLGLKKIKSKDPKAAEYDFSFYAKQKQLTHLVLFDVRMIGMTRSYANYFPTSDPVGYFSGLAYMIDLKSNSYLWYLPVEIRMPSEDSNWDEPPTFPSLTNAYYQALASGKDQMLTPLSPK